MAQQLVNPLGAVQEGQNYVDGLFAQNANRLAGGMLAGGDTKGAASTLYRSGDLAGGRQIMTQAATDATNARTQQTADSARQLQTTMQVVKALKAQRDSGQDVSAALMSYRPTFLALGTNPQEFDQIAAQIAANPAFLDQVEALTAQAMEYELRAGNSGDTVAVGLNKQTGQTSSRLAYAAPQAPQVTTLGILNPPARPLPVGQDTAYQPGTSTGAAILPGTQPLSQAAPAAATGAAISANPLWSRQIQQESGGKQFGANGQVLTSPKGAFGVAQLMPGTAADMARQMGVTVEQLRSDPALNEAAGQRYQQQQLEKYGGNQALALAAYNAGPGAVDAWLKPAGTVTTLTIDGQPRRFTGLGDPRTGEITTEEFVARIPYAETKNYVENITQGQYGQGDNEGSAGQTTSGLEQLGGGYTLQRMQTPADQRADRTEARMDRAEARAEALANRRARTLTPQEVAAQGFPEGSVVQERPDGSLNVVSGAKAEKFTQDQRTTAGFAYRLENATRTLSTLAQQGVEKPSPAILAFGEGRIRENALSQNDRRWLQAAREWLAPVLRRDTGAAVTPGELVTYMNTYLASPTDDPGTLAQKAQARLTAEQAMRGMAGGAYGQLLEDIRVQTNSPNGQRRRPQTNTGVVPYDLTPGQLNAWRSLGRSGGDPSRPRGDRLNPVPLNERDPSATYGNIPANGYYWDLEGVLRQKRSR